MAASLLLTACEGLFGGIYDNDKVSDDVETKAGQIYLDASSWSTWNYIDFATLDDEEGVEVVVEAIPVDEDASNTTGEGIYTYWFDVFGEGLSKNERRDFRPTASQPEPDKWTIAIHREVVRTNGCEVYETTLTSMDDLPASSSAYDNVKFEADTWSENDTWVDQSAMLSGIIGCQGIYINKVLSNWYTCEIPPMPPAYTMNNHVFILRTPEGRYAALQLANHLSPSGTKCCFTINYKYPY